MKEIPEIDDLEDEAMNTVYTFKFEYGPEARTAM